MIKSTKSNHINLYLFKLKEFGPVKIEEFLKKFYSIFYIDVDIDKTDDTVYFKPISSIYNHITK
jgi:hypothetical protein